MKNIRTVSAILASSSNCACRLDRVTGRFSNISYQRTTVSSQIREGTKKSATAYNLSQLFSSTKISKISEQTVQIYTKTQNKWRSDIVNIFDIGYLHCKHLDIGKNQHQLPASTTRQQHHTSQPPGRQPANQLLSLPLCHTHIMAARSVVV